MNVKELEQDLLNRYKQTGDPIAKRELVSSLTPLIRGQVSKFTNSGLPYDALELHGKQLASEAIDSYDPSFNTQLNTHVTNHLRKLSRYTNKYQNVGAIPEPRALMIGKYHTMFANLVEEKGREPTVPELADRMKVSNAEITRLQSELRNDLSIEFKSSDPDEGGFISYIAPDIEDPRVREAVEFVYFDSNPTDKKILEYTFGLGGVQKITAENIKTRLNLTENELRKRKDSLGKQIKELI